MRTLVMMFLVMLPGCNNIQSNNGSLSDSAVVKTDSSSMMGQQVKTDFTKETVITIRFPKDSTSVTVTGRLDGINKRVTVLIPVTKGNELNASLVPEDSVANIRISQVFMPGGKADGPFGRSLSRKITEEGNYKIVIAENLMQGDEWKGKFALKVIVK